MVAAYMLYDDYSRSNAPPQQSVPGSGIFPGDVDVETDFLLHSIRGQPVSEDLTLQPGETPLAGEPGDLPIPPWPKASREYAIRRPLSGLTEDVSIWTIPADGNVNATAVAEFFRDAALKLGYTVHSSPRLGHRRRSNNPNTSTSNLQTQPLASVSPSSETKPSDSTSTPPGTPKRKKLTLPPRRMPDPDSLDGQGFPPEGSESVPEESMTEQPTSEPMPTTVNIVMLRPRSFPPVTKMYLPPQVLLIRARTLKKGGVRLFLSVRYSSVPGMGVPDGSDTQPN
jgi:hypothetical protein